MKKQTTVVWLINEKLAKKRTLYWTPKYDVQVNVQAETRLGVEYNQKEKRETNKKGTT